jgi:hypothetical protein
MPVLLVDKAILQAKIEIEIQSKVLGNSIDLYLVCIYNFITALHYRVELRQATTTFAAFGNWEIADAVSTASDTRLKRF